MRTTNGLLHMHSITAPLRLATAHSIGAPPNSPADVAADDDVAAEDGARVHVVVDGAGDDRRGHRELDGGGVDDADDVARAGGLEDAEERAVAAVLRVQLDDLLVVVRALEELDSGVERAAVGLEEDLHAVDRRVER